MKNLSMGRPGTIFVLGAAILGALTAYFLYNYLQGVSTKAPPVVQSFDIVVPCADIPARQEIKPEMITVKKVPSAMLIPDTATRLDQVSGKFAVTALKALEQIRLKDVVERGKIPGLAPRIPKGMRAITIGISDTRGVSGAIYPGDHVDILCSLRDGSRGEQTVQVPLQNLLVLAIDRAKTEATDMGATSSLTLCAKPEEAQMLTVAEESGALRVILRSRDDQTILDDKAISLDQFVKKAPKQAEEPKPKEEKVVEQAPLSPAQPASPAKKIRIYEGSGTKEFDVSY